MESSVSEINIFDFSGKKTVNLKCSSDDCRESCVNLSTYNDKYRIEMYCPVCGETHIYNINKNIFWTRPVIKLKCNVSNMDILFIGEEKNIESAVNMQRDIFDDAKNHHDELNLVLEILECINSFADEGRMYCTCGCRAIRVAVFSNEIVLTCSDCGTKRTLDISVDTLSMLLNLESIVLK